MPGVLVVGGGIAGTSAAALLAEGLPPGSVTLLEAEPELARHSTGRSAAILVLNYGPDAVERLTRASRARLRPWLSPRGMLTLAAADQVLRLQELAGRLPEGEARLLDGAGAHAVCDAVDPAVTVAALHEEAPEDIDVAGLLDHFVARLRAAGGTILRGARVTAIRRTPTGWSVTSAAGEHDAELLVDAAGAWGDEIARLAGIAPVGLQPRKRTAFIAEVPGRDPADFSGWPMVFDVDENWYLRPESGGLLVSPADEQPSPPCDARPDELDVALALDLVNAATSLGLRRVRTAWAGLRTFAPDATHVLGPDPADPAFVWCVGQGGYGIQTAPAAAEVVAATTLGTPLPDDLLAAGVDGADYSAGRLRA